MGAAVSLDRLLGAHETPAAVRPRAKYLHADQHWVAIGEREAPDSGPEQVRTCPNASVLRQAVARAFRRAAAECGFSSADVGSFTNQDERVIRKQWAGEKRVRDEHMRAWPEVLRRRHWEILGAMRAEVEAEVVSARRER
jgi:hypothetical protein